MATPAKKAKVAPLPACPYGARCYRKNPQHLKEFSHPKGTDTVDGKTSLASTSTVDTSKLPPCKYGAACYRKNLLHFAEYSHPTTKVKDDSGSDTDVYSSDEDDKKKDKKKDAVKTEDILKRGMSLVKSYSKMSEEERKELIKKAFEAKQKLQKELEDTKIEMKAKDKELDRLQKEVNTGLLLMDGEKEALEGKKTVYFTLNAERKYKEGSAAQTHFRLAESQFYRLLVGQYNVHLEKVEYVINPELHKRFREARENLKKHRSEDMSYPVLAFHGTKQENISLICENGFKVPGESGFSHRTDTGWYGKGVYFSEYPSYSMSYIQGGTKLLLCQVLPGKVFQCTKLIHGAALAKGYDSHTSPDKKELVIFNSHHILPSYIVHYKAGAAGEFKYKATADGSAGSTSGTGTCDLSKHQDPTHVSTLYYQAINVKASKVLAALKVQFTGTFQGTQAEMMNLAVKHGATKGTPSVFTVLFASDYEFETKTNKVQKATSKGVPVVVEAYLYDCIIKKKLLPTTGYEYK